MTASMSSILIAQRHRPMARVLELRLQAVGIAVHVTEDPQAGLDLATKPDTDLLIVGPLPDPNDALELIGRLRQEPDNADLPVFLITPRDDKLPTDTLTTFNIDRVFAEPISPGQIVSAACQRLRSTVPQDLFTS